TSLASQPRRCLRWIRTDDDLIESITQVASYPRGRLVDRFGQHSYDVEPVRRLSTGNRPPPADRTTFTPQDRAVADGHRQIPRDADRACGGLVDDHRPGARPGPVCPPAANTVRDQDKAARSRRPAARRPACVTFSSSSRTAARPAVTS